MIVLVSSERVQVVSIENMIGLWSDGRSGFNIGCVTLGTVLLFIIIIVEGVCPFVE